ncbi:MAG: Crp/Fnr family transcriptional regulator [Bacteroidales bacterium]|nr:Crp/Fnr family transcriptional regulator [Bacteroidales bacterium]
MKANNKSNKSEIKNIVNICFDESRIADILRLCNNQKSKFFKSNENIFDENSKPTTVYYLREGKVKIFKKGNNGSDQIIRFVSAGDLFGIRSIITGTNHTTSVTAIEDSMICRIPIEDFLELLEEKPELSYCIIACLNKLLIEAEKRNESLVLKSEKERLAEALLVVYKKFGSETIKLLKKDLVDYTNIRRDKLTRYLHKFSENRLIAFNSERIKLIDINGLQNLAKMSA